MRPARRIRVPTIARAVEPRALVQQRARRRVWALAGVFAVVLGALAARGISLCLNPDPRTLAFASAQRWEQMVVRAKRGEIFDRNGARLATSVDSPTVVVDPSRVRPTEREALAAMLAQVLDLPADDLLGQLSRDHRRYAKLASRVHPHVANTVRRMGVPALWIEQNRHRFYPEKTLASQVLGYVNSEDVGRMGVERTMNAYLQGSAVLLQRRRDRLGRDVERLSAPDRTMHAGLSVHLTLDRHVQRMAERALEGVVERHGPKAAMAVVVEVQTGDILAMASAPVFNPNQVGEDPAPRRNRVIQDAIEPGSVIKPFAIAAALQEGLVVPSSTIDCEMGGWYLGRVRIGDDHPHGVIPVGEVLKYSSNIGAAKLALRLGPDTTVGYLRRFGFGTPSGIALPGERSGYLRPIDRIRPIELATTAYGQGMTATPLQLAMGVAALANGGVLMRPRLVTQVVDRHGVPAVSNQPTPVRRVVSEQTARVLTEMMVAVTEPGGTGVHARVPGYQVAGKTGTAEKVVGGQYTSARIGSFVGYLPAYNPKVAIVVVVDEPQVGSRYGGVVAAPAFAEIGASVMSYFGIPPNPNHLPADQHLAAVPAPQAAAPGSPVTDSAPAQPAPLQPAPASAPAMPDLTGQPLRGALAQLQHRHLQVQWTGSGRVLQQHPRPGTALAAGGSVSLTLH